MTDDRYSLIIAVMTVLGLIGLVVLYALEFRFFDLTLDSSQLVKGALLTGLVIGIVLSFWKVPRQGDLTDRIRIHLMIIFFFCIFSPLFASWINRLFLHSTARIKVEFVEEKAYYASRYGFLEGERPRPTGFYLFFYQADELRRIKTKSPHFSGSEPGDSIQLPIIEGRLGFDVVMPAKLPSD
ncbi:MAG: hypothetical protein R3350_10980 [Saprospiraceae bacterium]|nr:hypothetical protein [Saprospiraceae bacterium]